MRVIIGCDPLLTPLTGIGHYSQQLGRGMLLRDNIEMKLFAHGKFFPNSLLHDQDLNCSHSAENQVKITTRSRITANIRNKLASSSTVVKCYQQLAPYLMKYALRNHGNWIFHSPNFTLPQFDGKRIVTIHDLSTVRFPQYHPKSRVEFVNNSIDYAVEYADHIITDSTFVRQEILDSYSVNPNRVSAVGLGASSSFKVRAQEDCQAILSLNGLRFGQYFLFVSTIEPRKNLQALLEAFSEYRHRSPHGFPLIIVGGDGWNNREILEKISLLSAKGWVKHLGYVRQDYLPVFYSAARALLFPSLYEGFGLPVLEAIQSGTAVMTSVDSSMSEITADSAALISPYDVDEQASSILRLEQDTNYVDGLVKKGLLRSKQFSWDKCVEDTLSIYETLDK